jgi:hypothetical protein
MKMQKEEKRAVMRLELLWAVCGLKDEDEAPRWGTYEGAVKPDLATGGDR